MIHTYPIDAYRNDTRDAYASSEQTARTFGKKFGCATLTVAAAREYLLTLPPDEEIDQWTYGDCLGVRTIRWLYPQAIENGALHISFATSTGNFWDDTTYWHVHASYDFADLMWRCYRVEDFPSCLVTARDLLKLISEYPIY